MPSLALSNTARVFAMVAFADGSISPSEEHRFARFVASEASIKAAAQADIHDAWTVALKETQAAQSFGGALVTVRSWARGQPEKEMMMRAAQAALVADNKLDLQENAAMIALAEALGLDPNKY